MVDRSDSYLESRRAEMLENQQVVPLDYDELRDQAFDHLSKGPYDYTAGGAGTEDTMCANRAAFRRVRIVPRALRDVTERDLKIELFGCEAAAPLVLAPIGGQIKYHEEGELATARAAGDLGIPMVLSTAATHSIEDVAVANGDGPRFFQLYWPNDWEVARSFIERAELSGYDGIVYTVDSKLSKWRHRDLTNAYNGPTDAPKGVYESDPVVQERARDIDKPLREYVRVSPELDDDPSITWDDLDTLREWTDLPIILKGILSSEDARRAAELGIEGIVVSNHGGRQVDGAVSALNQLPSIVDAVDKATTVILDSGVRSGADAFKALALGADAVQFGRPYIFGLAISGQQGVREVILNVLAELESTVGLTGHSSVDQIDRHAITHVPKLVSRNGGSE